MDPFQQFAAWDEATARRWATGLDERAADPQQVALRAGILAAARLRPGQVAVEVGCGTGPLLAGLADAVGPTGRVLGSSHSRRWPGSRRAGWPGAPRSASAPAPPCRSGPGSRTWR